MNIQSKKYLERLKDIYGNTQDNDSLFALADIEKAEDRARDLAIYRELPKTQELIDSALRKYKFCIEKLTSEKNMSQDDRIYYFAMKDWCMFTLDIVGIDPAKANAEVDNLVLEYAKKAGI